VESIIAMASNGTEDFSWMFSCVPILCADHDLRTLAKVGLATKFLSRPHRNRDGPPSILLSHLDNETTN
jgi:hypothetical protein